MREKVVVTKIEIVPDEGAFIIKLYSNDPIALKNLLENNTKREIYATPEKLVIIADNLANAEVIIKLLSDKLRIYNFHINSIKYFEESYMKILGE